MKIGNYDLTQTEDGEGIYINCILVDDKRGCPSYWKGWEEWVKILSVTDLYDYWKRNEIITEIRQKY